MKAKVYLETTIVSCLTARPTRNVIIAGMTAETKTWWEQRRNDFDLCIAEPVLRESARGDSDAADRRQRIPATLPLVSVTEPMLLLAKSFPSHFAMPANASDDALHVAIAAVHRVEYLLTWNCRHIANATMRPRLEALCQLEGYRCPIICTPPQLMQKGSP